MEFASTGGRNASKNLVHPTLTDFSPIEKKRLEKREKLHLTENNIRTTIAKNMRVFHESQTLWLEGLATFASPQEAQVALATLVRPYEGLQEYKLTADCKSATVRFATHEDAKLALAGNYPPTPSNLFLYRAP
jgi:hypothetical protein